MAVRNADDKAGCKGSTFSWCERPVLDDRNVKCARALCFVFRHGNVGREAFESDREVGHNGKIIPDFHHQVLDKSMFIGVLQHLVVEKL